MKKKNFELPSVTRKKELACLIETVEIFKFFSYGELWDILYYTRPALSHIPKFGDATSPAEDNGASPNFGICETTLLDEIRKCLKQSTL